jgi:hypothetical protein
MIDLKKRKLIAKIIGFVILFGSIHHFLVLYYNLIKPNATPYVPFKIIKGIGAIVYLVQLFFIVLGGIGLISYRQCGFVMIYLAFLLMAIFVMPVYAPLPITDISPFLMAYTTIAINVTIFVFLIYVHYNARKYKDFVIH